MQKIFRNPLGGGLIWRGTGYIPVESEIVCVLTRFETRALRGLMRLYLMYRQVKRQAREVDGYLATYFVLESRTTCFTLSLWRDVQSIERFNSNCVAHLNAANACFRDLKFLGGPTLWSAQFGMTGVSPHNMKWPGMDFGQLFVAKDEAGVPAAPRSKARVVG